MRIEGGLYRAAPGSAAALPRVRTPLATGAGASHRAGGAWSGHVAAHRREVGAGVTARAPVQWYGGKAAFLPHLLPLVPPHDMYLESHGGMASLLLGKPPCEIETYNDLDSGLVNLFRVLRDPEQMLSLQDMLRLTPYSREEYLACRAGWKAEADPVRKAWMWFVVARQGVSGQFGTSGWSYTLKSGGGSAASYKYRSSIEWLPEVCARLEHVQIEHSPWQRVVASHDRRGCFWYADPPYVLSTRVGGRRYRHEMEDAEHAELIEVALAFSGMALISGYASALYDRLDRRGWRRVEVETTAHSAGSTAQTRLLGFGAKRAHRRVECLWMNYNIQEIRGQMPLFTGEVECG